jgi:hypothetical protein
MACCEILEFLGLFQNEFWPLYPWVLLKGEFQLLINYESGLPVGLDWMSSSKVSVFPPALVILALADSLNLSAHTVSLGTESTLTSSVTVPT